MPAKWNNRPRQTIADRVVAADSRRSVQCVADFGCNNKVERYVAHFRDLICPLYARFNARRQCRPAGIKRRKERGERGGAKMPEKSWTRCEADFKEKRVPTVIYLTVFPFSLYPESAGNYTRTRNGRILDGAL